MADDAKSLPVLKSCRCGPQPEPIAPHTCPYREDVNNDSETLCTCCPDCKHECAMDI